MSVKLSLYSEPSARFKCARAASYPWRRAICALTETCPNHHYTVMDAGAVALEPPLRQSDEAVDGGGRGKGEKSKGGMSRAMMRLLATTVEVRDDV